MCLRPAISATVGPSGGAVTAAIDAAPGPAEWGTWGGLQGVAGQSPGGVREFPAAMAGAGATVTDLLLSRQQQHRQQQQQQQQQHQQEEAWADYRQQWERQRESQGPTTFIWTGDGYAIGTGNRAQQPSADLPPQPQAQALAAPPQQQGEPTWPQMPAAGGPGGGGAAAAPSSARDGEARRGAPSHLLALLSNAVQRQQKQQNPQQHPQQRQPQPQQAANHREMMTPVVPQQQPPPAPQDALQGTTPWVASASHLHPTTAAPAVASEPLLPSWQPLPSQQPLQPLQPLQHMGLTLPTGTPFAAPPLVSPTSVVTTTGVPGHAGLSMGAVYPGMGGHGAVDEKKVKRMMSNRASAKRSRKRRQERLEELEVLSASLHVDNASAQRRLNEAQDTIRRLQRSQQALQRSVAEANAQLAAATAVAATAEDDDDDAEEDGDGDAPSSVATPSAAAVASGGGAPQREGAGGMEARAAAKLPAQVQLNVMLAPLHPQEGERLLLRSPLDLAGRLQGGIGAWGGESGTGGVDAEEEQDDRLEEEDEVEEEGDDEECGEGSEEGQEELEEGAVGGVSAEAETGELSGLEGGTGCEVAAPTATVDFDSLMASAQGILNPAASASASFWMNGYGRSVGRVG
ncbi:unnamed protein product [Closterium sp. Naga37s-1]|nr:unnamed protein product [Closterium sp. Naga37s-1]